MNWVRVSWIGAALLAAAPLGAQDLSGRLTGTVTYRQFLVLPPGAEVDVRLLDVTRADGPGVLVRGLNIRPASAPPIPFDLRYDPAAIRPERSYALEATIAVDGRVRFRSPRRVPVLTAGRPRDRVELLLEAVPGGVDAPGQPVADSAVRGTLGYLQRIALPAAAEAEVSLVELGRDDRPREVLATQVIRPAGQPPISFEVRYNAGEVREAIGYGLVARILVDDRPLFATAAPVRVLTQGHPKDQLRLVLPMAAAPAATPRPPAVGPDPAERAREADRRIAAYRRTEGTWRSAQASSRFDAHFLDGELARIDERLSLGAMGSADQRYYFTDGVLTHYRSDGRRRASGGAALQAVTLTLSLDAAGRVLEGRKTVEGREVPIPEADARVARSHAATLAALAEGQSAAAPPPAVTARVERGPTGFGPVVVTADGQTRRLNVRASGVWVTDGGKVVLYAVAGGAGGFEGEGQALYRYDPATGQSRRIFAERYLIRDVREARSRSGARALLVRMTDGGLGAPHAAVAHPERGLVWRASFARLGAPVGGTVRAEHLPRAETDDWAAVKPLRTETLDLDRLLAGPAVQAPR